MKPKQQKKLQAVPAPKQPAKRVSATLIVATEAERVAAIEVVTEDDRSYVGLVVDEDFEVVSDEDLDYEDDPEAFKDDAEEAQEVLEAFLADDDGHPLQLEPEDALRTKTLISRFVYALRTRYIRERLALKAERDLSMSVDVPGLKAVTTAAGGDA